MSYALEEYKKNDYRLKRVSLTEPVLMNGAELQNIIENRTTELLQELQDSKCIPTKLRKKELKAWLKKLGYLEQLVSTEYEYSISVDDAVMLGMAR